MKNEIINKVSEKYLELQKISDELYKSIDNLIEDLKCDISEKLEDLHNEIREDITNKLLFYYTSKNENKGEEILDNIKREFVEYLVGEIAVLMNLNFKDGLIIKGDTNKKCWIINTDINDPNSNKIKIDVDKNNDDLWIDCKDYLPDVDYPHYIDVIYKDDHISALSSRFINKHFKQLEMLKWKVTRNYYEFINPKNKAWLDWKYIHSFTPGNELVILHKIHITYYAKCVELNK